MNKYTLLLIILILSSCSSDTLESKKKRVDDLKSSLLEINLELYQLEKEISLVDSTFGNKRYDLVSTIIPEINTFYHKIQLRGNIQSKKNILIVSEVVSRYDNIRINEGDFVKKGEVLASINSSLISSTLKEIKTNLDLLETIYLRQEKLWKSNIGSEIEYLRSKSNFESLSNRYNATKIQVSKYNITAPFSGIVDNIFVKVGEMSNPSMPAFRMYNKDESYILIDMPENYLSSYNVGDSVRVSKNENNVIFSSIILSIGQVIDPLNRTFSIEVDIPENYQSLVKPNQIIEVKFIDYKNENAISLPSELIFSDESGNYIFEIKDFDGEKIAKKIPVLIGRSFDYKTEILSGLEGNETIIFKGSSDVVDGSFVKVKN
jgi:membrane fusion protein (multidrug efflux system)|tara:strand:- start:587 stop:1714 length:1128 start_codon:yes stop_codon:yes gene_type:complete